MRFLHTADWHLGKNFYSVSLIEDQKYFLEKIFSLLESAKDEKNPYSALLIPGDIYDRAVPASDASVLLDSLLSRLKNNFPELAILILSGNHDSAKRLSFASSFLKKDGIYIASSASDITTPIEIDGVCFYQLPFLTSLEKEGEDGFSILRTRSEICAEACRRILLSHQIKNNTKRAVLCAHETCFEKGDETYSVGTAEIVRPETFLGFDYVALGHIHKMMCVKKSNPAIWYSGSPLAYSFDDSGKKGVLSVEIDTKTGGTTVEKIAIEPLHPVKRLSLTFSELDSADEAQKWENCYIEAICTDNTSADNPMAILEKRYPHILSFRRKAKKRSGESEEFEMRKKIMQSGKKDADVMSDMFSLFMKDLYGDKLDEKQFQSEKAVFDFLCAEAEREEEQ